VQSAQEGWEVKLKEDGVNLLVLASTQPALVKAVQSSNQWCREYQDDVAFIAVPHNLL